MIKIDKSFVMEMAIDASDAAIVRSTIDLAHNLGLRVVAEGVESHQAWTRLNELGCDLAQGFYVSRPLPAPDLGRLLHERRASAEDLRADAPRRPRELATPLHFTAEGVRPPRAASRIPCTAGRRGGRAPTVAACAVSGRC